MSLRTESELLLSETLPEEKSFLRHSNKILLKSYWSKMLHIPIPVSIISKKDESKYIIEAYT